jgi:hypothetical protein
MYVSETNVVAKVIDSTINRTPCIALLAKPVEINRMLFTTVTIGRGHEFSKNAQQLRHTRNSRPNKSLTT